MLNGFPVTRFASNHSPARERREVFFVKKAKDPVITGYDAFEENADTSHEFLRQEITDLQKVTRQKLEEVLGDIVALPLYKTHTAIETPLYSLPKILEDKRSKILNLLDRNLVEMDARDSSETVRKMQGILKSELENLAGFKKHMESIGDDKNIMSIGSKDADDNSNLRGYYDRAEKGIFLDSTLSAEEAKGVKEHEQGHGVMHAIELHLDPSVLKKIYEDPRHAEAVENHLGKLKDEEAYAGKDADAVVAQRYFQSRYQADGSGLSERGGRHEEALFELLGKRPALQPENYIETFIADLEEHDATGIVTRLGTIGNNVTGTQDPAHEHYAWCNGDPRLLLMKLMARYDKWSSASYRKQFDGHFESAEENKILEETKTALEQHVQKCVQKELEDMRAKTKESAVFEAFLDKLGMAQYKRYGIYGGDHAGIQEELVNRYADFQAGRDAGTFSPEELAIFYLWNPNIELPANQKTDTQSRIDDVRESLGLPRSNHVRTLDESGDTENEGKRYSMRDDQDQEEEKDGEKKNEAKNGEEKEKTVNAEKLLEDIRMLQKGMKHLVGEAERAVSHLRSLGAPAKELDAWESHSKYLAEGLQTTNMWNRATMLIAQWRKKPRIAPGDFITAAPMALDLKKESKEEYEQFLQMVHAAAPGGKWMENDNAPEMQAMETLLNDMLTDIDGTTRDWDKKITQVREEAKQIEKTQELSTQGGTWTIKWYTLSHLIEAVNDVWGSYKKAISQWSTLRTSELAHGIGSALSGVPYFGEQAKVSLEMELDHKNDEIKDTFKKHLEHDLATFDHCCLGDHGGTSLLKQYDNEPNKFRAVLEYMASKGWLYDMDVLKGSAFGATIADKLPPTWPDKRKEQYVRDLGQQNSSGEDRAEKDGHSRVNSYPDIPPMMKVLEDEMNRRNYWAILGIMKRAIEKGKTGETSAWLCTIVMKYLEEDPIARTYFPKGLMDQLGNIGIVSPVWLTTFFKLDRHELVKYQNGLVPLERAGVMASTIKLIEQDIQNAQIQATLPYITNKQDLNHLVAKVMASQTIRENGWTRSISVYKDRYKDYRKEIARTKTSIKPASADDDFYNAYSNGGSEVQLLGTDGYQSILPSNTTGDLIHETKAKYFLEQLVHRFEDLSEPGLESEKANYLRETQEKMHVAALSWNHAGCPKLLEINFRGDKRQKLIIELLKRDIITVSTIREAVGKKILFGIAAWKAAHKLGLPGYEEDITA